MIDYYALLQVSPSASEEEIRKAFRRQAKRYHPDLQQQRPETEQREAQRRFVELTQAYETLSEPQRRQTYDRQYRAQAQAKRSQPHQKASAHSSSSDSRRRTRPEPQTDFTDFAETSLEDLLQDVEGLLRQFGIQRTDPLEVLLEWARKIYREVLEALQEEEDAPKSHRTERPFEYEHSSTRESSTQGSSTRTRPQHEDPRADIEAELERLKRHQQASPKSSPRPAQDSDIESELERLKRKYRP